MKDRLQHATCGTCPFLCNLLVQGRPHLRVEGAGETAVSRRMVQGPCLDSWDPLLCVSALAPTLDTVGISFRSDEDELRFFPVCVVKGFSVERLPVIVYGALSSSWASSRLMSSPCLHVNCIQSWCKRGGQASGTDAEFRWRVFGTKLKTACDIRLL